MHLVLDFHVIVNYLSVSVKLEDTGMRSSMIVKLQAWFYRV